MKKRIVAAVVLAVALVSAGFTLYTPDLGRTDLEARYANTDSKFVEVDGLRMHYRDQGSGPALLLIHGSNASLHTWEGWVKELSDDFRIISFDLPGHGLTGPDAKKRYGWIPQAELAGRLMEALDIERFSVAGNSLGGAIAWNLAVLEPERVENLILIDSIGYPREEPLPLILRAYGTPVLGDVLTVVTPRAAIRDSLESVYGDPQKVGPEMVELYHDLNLREGNRQATHERLSLADDNDHLNKLASLQVPTLILWGAKDTWVHPKYAGYFARDIKNSDVIIYDDLGMFRWRKRLPGLLRMRGRFLCSDGMFV
ncbi:alpha/beta fold hydrolase [Roseibium sp. RKSG952]|uniref:alpha/beta fold hydrolase n=1 Tax=Roseibium sp. RKSG952 TaxID=2529384 RepID=UPI0018AD1DF0|nr:alpha/beta hydrolase [Roseibium sp. RKSG952]